MIFIPRSSSQDVRNQLISSLVRIANRVNSVGNQLRRRKGSDLPALLPTIPFASCTLGPRLGVCQKLQQLLDAWENSRPELDSLLQQYTASLREKEIAEENSDEGHIYRHEPCHDERGVGEGTSDQVSSS